MPKIRVTEKPTGARSIRCNPVNGLVEALEIRQTKTGFGFRDWFVCPSCGKRCGVLYARPHFGCKQCHGLHHAVEHEGQFDRALRAAFKHRRKHGLNEGGVIAPFPLKPHRMRWHTYLKARKTDDQLLKSVASNCPMSR